MTIGTSPNRATNRAQAPRLKRGLGLMVIAWLAGLDLPGTDQALPPALWPQPQDYTQMWWAEGFPGTVASAPWLRCIQTGRYAVVLDTRTMRIAQQLYEGLEIGEASPAGLITYMRTDSVRVADEAL